MDATSNEWTYEIHRGEVLQTSVDRMVGEHTHLARQNPSIWWQSQLQYLQRNEVELKELKEEYEALLSEGGKEDDPALDVRRKQKLRQLLLETQNHYTVVLAVDQVIKENPQLFGNLQIHQTEDISVEGEDEAGAVFESNTNLSHPLASVAEDLKRDIARYERLLQGKPRS